jgi:hypothetical protein
MYKSINYHEFGEWEKLMKNNIEKIGLESMNCEEFENHIYKQVFEAYRKNNLQEYFLIIKLMKWYSEERKDIITNALIVINDLFFIEKRRKLKNSEGQFDLSYAQKILKTIWV